jgi:parallel beta-helix repeat protein
MGPLNRARKSSVPLAAAVSLAAAITLLSGGPALAETSACTLYASPGGSDSSPGTTAAPFATIQRLANALSAGQTGCARGGTYTQDVTVGHGGSAGAPLTITSYPGERATLIGRLYLREGADYVTFSNMNLNGRNSSKLPSPTINDTNATFVGNDVTNEHTEICFLVGSGWGRAKGALIERNRIHDCGVLPAANHDHGIYVDDADNTQILENVIYDNADRGIQLYPDAQGTLIEHNIIDANGEGVIFSGASGTASSNSTVRGNLITNALIRYDVESWWPSGNPVGQNNLVQSNCVWGGAQGTIQESSIGFSASFNLTANPAYANPSTGDYRVGSTSLCAPYLLGTSVPTQPFGASSTEVIKVEPVKEVTEPAPTGTTTEPSSGGGTGKTKHKRLQSTSSTSTLGATRSTTSSASTRRGRASTRAGKHAGQRAGVRSGARSGSRSGRRAGARSGHRHHRRALRHRRHRRSAARAHRSTHHTPR